MTLLSKAPWVRRPTYDGLYFHDLAPKWVRPLSLRNILEPCLAMVYMIQHASVVHMSFLGGPWGQTSLWRLEAYLFRWAGIRTIVIPFGSDAFMLSQVLDPSLRHVLLIHWPELAKQEAAITKRVRYWTHHADALLTGLMVDGMGRWDIPLFNMLCIDVDEWQPKATYSAYDGRNGSVKVLHAPNHRGFKGTEFVVQAVKELQAEGLQVELILLEKVPNTKVRELMQEADILAEQLIIGYGLNGIEGMVSGLPELSNLEHEMHTRLFRRYAYLNECPIVSTAPETVKQNLRALVRNPGLREQLGRAGRCYVEKYHSYTAAQYLFGSIYDKILYGKEVDLMNLFHPLKSSYNTKLPLVEHPLNDNHLPEAYLQ